MTSIQDCINCLVLKESHRDSGKWDVDQLEKILPLSGTLLAGQVYLEMWGALITDLCVRQGSYVQSSQPGRTIKSASPTSCSSQVPVSISPLFQWRGPQWLKHIFQRGGQFWFWWDEKMIHLFSWELVLMVNHTLVLKFALILVQIFQALEAMEWPLMGTSDKRR